MLPTAENLLLQLIPFLKQNKGSKTLTFIQYIYKKNTFTFTQHMREPASTLAVYHLVSVAAERRSLKRSEGLRS